MDEKEIQEWTKKVFDPNFKLGVGEKTQPHKTDTHRISQEEFFSLLSDFAKRIQK
jgi:hypothetical protein